MIRVLSKTKPILNKKASFNYNLLDKFEAGIVLTGNEIKQVRAGKASLTDSYVVVRDGEAFLINAYVAPYEKAAETSSSDLLNFVTGEYDSCFKFVKKIVVEACFFV